MRIFPTAPAEERAHTLTTLAEAGMIEPPRMGPRWHSDSGIATLQGVAESLKTRRQMLDEMPPEAKARRIEQLEAFPEDLDARDRQQVALHYLVPTAAEKDLGQWVDRQYGTGRIAAGYVLVSIRLPGGRPAIGTPIQVRLPAELLARLDAASAAADVTRPEMIRRVLARELS